MSNAKCFPLTSRTPTTSLRQPKEICSYSRTFEGDYVNDDSSLSYYYLPDAEVDTGIDLSAGFKKFSKFDEDRDGELDGFLGALKNYEEKKGAKVKADIISWRGIMRDLMVLPYNNRDPIDLYLVWFDGHIFIQTDKAAKKSRETEPTPELKQLMYSGYKFESIATIPKPLAEASRQMIDGRFKKITNNSEQYASVVRTGVGKTKIIIAGEVDCVWDSKPSKNPSSSYVELKTSKVIENPKQCIGFERKLFKTWAQCFLLGINKIIYGFRDDNLILRSVEQFNTEEIPIKLRNNPVNTNPRKMNCTDCLKWYGAVVEWIVQEVPHDETRSWKLKYDPAMKTLSLSENDPAINQQVLNGGVIPDFFKKWRLRDRQCEK